MRCMLQVTILFAMFAISGCVDTGVPTYDAGKPDKYESPVVEGRWYIKSKGKEEDEAKTWSFDIKPSKEGNKHISCMFADVLLINKEAKKAWVVSIKHTNLPFSTLAIGKDNRFFWKYVDPRSSLTFELVGEFLTPTTVQGNIKVEDTNESVKASSELSFEGSVGESSQEAEESVKEFCTKCYKEKACTP